MSMLHGLLVVLFVVGVLSDTTQRLTAINACKDSTIWIASQNMPGVSVVKLDPGATHTYNIDRAGVSSTRFWPKLGCNSQGQECKIGDSGGPGQTCTSGQGCGPPVDSKFEASFGNQDGNCQLNAADCDWWDTSGVDGFTIPYKVELTNDCKTFGYKGVDLDCSELTMEMCPTNENIGGVGAVDLRVHSPVDNSTVGCYSPCGVLTYNNWKNPYGKYSPDSSEAVPYCCPTPPESAAACRAGPAPTSQYSNLIHSKCPGVYSYAYDDEIGLQVCPPNTIYTWTLFCPGTAPTPPTPPTPPSPPSPPAPSTWSPCTKTSLACCNPHSKITQYCPGTAHEACQECGGGDACECPQDVEV